MFKQTFVLNKLLKFDTYQLANGGFVRKNPDAVAFAASTSKTFGAITPKHGVGWKNIWDWCEKLVDITYLRAMFGSDRLTPERREIQNKMFVHIFVCGW